MGIEEIGALIEVVDITDLVVKSMGLPILAVSHLSKLLQKKRKEVKHGDLSYQDRTFT
jgi:hypothetical protein